MATQSKTAAQSENSVRAFLARHPITFTLVLMAASFLVLLTISRSDLFFPLWSSIAFPTLAVIPFLILTLHIPIRVNVWRIALLVVWFVVLLIINQVLLSNAPSDNAVLHWSPVVLPTVVIITLLILAFRVPKRINIPRRAFLNVNLHVPSTMVKVLLGLIVVLIMIPYLGLKDSFYLELAVQIGIFAAMALGLNIVVGFAGLLDLGYIAFFAVGAYLWGIFSSTGSNNVILNSNALASPELFWIFLIFGVGLAALAGILLGLPVLRLKGDYLAIVTLGFGEMVRVLMSNLGNVSSDPAIKINITNGAQGLPGIASPPLPPFVFDAVQSVATFFNINITNINSITYQLFFYVLVLAIGILIVAVTTGLENSPIGRAWTAIREDEVAARAMGVPLVKMKLMAFAMGASFAGAMGVIYAAKQTFVSPESFSFNQSIFILVIVIVGGMGSIRGVILGAVAVTLLNLQILPNLSIMLNSLKTSPDVSETLRNIFKAWPNQLEPAKYQRFVFGIMLVLMMIFRPAGILPERRRKMEIEAQMKGEDEVAHHMEDVLTPLETLPPLDNGGSSDAS